MRWRVLARALAGVLAVAAGLAVLWQVHVGGAGSARACGSVLDVAADRVDWADWWRQDQADPAPDTLLRTRSCPGALNRRAALAGGLALGAVAVLAVGELRRPAQPSRPPDARLRRLGTAATALGAGLTAGGVMGAALLLADRESAVFLYVDRPVVALLAAVALVPAVVLIVLGRAIKTCGAMAARTPEQADAPAP